MRESFVLEEDLTQIELCRKVLLVEFGRFLVEFHSLWEVALDVFQLSKNEVEVTLQVLNVSSVVGVLSHEVFRSTVHIQHLQTMLTYSLSHFKLLDFHEMISDQFECQGIVAVRLEALFDMIHYLLFGWTFSLGP